MSLNNNLMLNILLFMRVLYCVGFSCRRLRRLRWWLQSSGSRGWD